MLKMNILQFQFDNLIPVGVRDFYISPHFIFVKKNSQYLKILFAFIFIMHFEKFNVTKPIFASILSIYFHTT